MNQQEMRHLIESVLMIEGISLLTVGETKAERLEKLFGDVHRIAHTAFPISTRDCCKDGNVKEQDDKLRQNVKDGLREDIIDIDKVTDEYLAKLGITE